jgi:hypothetical protein
MSTSAPPSSPPLRVVELSTPEPVADAGTVTAITAILAVITLRSTKLRPPLPWRSTPTPTPPSTRPFLASGLSWPLRAQAEFGEDPARYEKPPGPTELRRDRPDHPPVREIEDCPAANGPQPAPRRRVCPLGVLLLAPVTRRPRLLRHPPSPEQTPLHRPLPARQPMGRHPARRPRQRPALQGDHRLA